MPDKDTFITIKSKAEGQVTEKRSKFLAFAYPVEDVESVKELLDGLKKEYYDARHICWAYMLGPHQEVLRANDDGEPSGTAGKPILGQIKSNELTNIVIFVIRYFGGVKLGTGGLIVAYKEAAAECLSRAEFVEKTIDKALSFYFDYTMMNAVMKIIKDLEPQIVTQTYDNECFMTLQIRAGLFLQLMQRLSKIESLRFVED
ncbi:MAG: YigZ family protein [Dysgonamonadaceae bacterium]